MERSRLLRLSPSEDEDLVRRARAAGTTVANYIRSKLWPPGTES